jgi:hypothetical protein
MLHLRLLPPRSYRELHRPLEWEVTDEAGQVVGWIEEHHIPTASRPFYMLRAIHPGTGEIIPLELSTDRDERLEKLAAFRSNPDPFHMHYPSGSKAKRAIEDRRGGPVWKLTGGRSGRHG